MPPKRYLISYEWAAGRNGKFFWHQHYSTDSFVLMLFKFIRLKFRYSAISLDYRR